MFPGRRAKLISMADRAWNSLQPPASATQCPHPVLPSLTLSFCLQQKSLYWTRQSSQFTGDTSPSGRLSPAIRVTPAIAAPDLRHCILRFPASLIDPPKSEGMLINLQE
ncbi:hypothetical protein E2C01_002538 [Portunus trituberculatus]|uniref:Uncharacterized protein n=1 Tax=Portunus trituberculatus TaxID=210409 RepID=A0A5B7CLH3_PORTR|nr:hypothetical protein [Portunus trituberculatus]